MILELLSKQKFQAPTQKKKPKLFHVCEWFCQSEIQMTIFFKY